MGGSANVVIRGYSSLNGSNQALFVVDGTPINNSTNNTRDLRRGRGGFDYGNAAMDMNPEDVESVTVLKGSAATALYGSRASNGVILITTKKGVKSDGLGITLNSTWLSGSIDNETMPVYQNKYGQGYGPYYSGPGNRWDEWGDNLAVLTGEDASYGAPYDSNLNVHHWFNMIPEWGDYGGTAPYASPKNTAHKFFNNSSTFTNSISLNHATDSNNFRLGYTNTAVTGILPNSKIDRNSFTFVGSQDFGKLNARANFTYTKTEGLGRYGTGYDGRNVFSPFVNGGVSM